MSKPLHTFSTTAGDRYFRSTLSIFDRVKVGLPIQQNELLTLQGGILQAVTRPMKPQLLKLLLLLLR